MEKEILEKVEKSLRNGLKEYTKYILNSENYISMQMNKVAFDTIYQIFSMIREEKDEAIDEMADEMTDENKEDIIQA